uniref:Uncharacterized protein n=1 Tax=Oryza barthii TaxID=65489 RepID=A0A0D3HAT0_9ORYZ
MELQQSVDEPDLNSTSSSAMTSMLSVPQILKSKNSALMQGMKRQRPRQHARLHDLACVHEEHNVEDDVVKEGAEPVCAGGIPWVRVPHDLAKRSLHGGCARRGLSSNRWRAWETAERRIDKPWIRSSIVSKIGCRSARIEQKSLREISSDRR